MRICRSLLIGAFSALILASSCKKDEVQVISGNEALPDGTIENITVETYMNKIFIGLLGRKGTPSEIEICLHQLHEHNFSVDDRKDFLDILMAKPEYLQNLYTIARSDYLNGQDTTEIYQWMQIFRTERDKPANAAFKEAFDYEIGRLRALRLVPTDLAAGSISIREAYRRCADNYFYDQINMGSANFVISAFQNFLFRYPTAEEEKSGVNMVDGKPSNAFFVNGSTKAEYLDIFFNSDDYYEGRVRYLYRKYLYKEPESKVLRDLTLQYKSSQSYKELQKVILSDDEYAGIK